MAVANQTPYIEYNGNGTTTNFPLTFDCENASHLQVSIDGATALSWSLSAGSVVFNAAPANGTKIVIQRNTPLSRTTNYTQYDNSFRPAPVNKDFDLIWRKLQELGVADWLLTKGIAAETTARMAADVAWDQVSQGRDNDLKNYIDGVVAGITGQPFFSIPDSFVMLQNGRTQRDKNSDTVSALDFGIIPNLDTDQSIQVQEALNTVAATGSQKTLVFASGRYRLDSTVNIPIGLNITGESMPMFNGGDFHGTFFYLNHTGVGFDATGAVGVRHISRIATMRNQPDPNGETFTPNSHDWDFKFRSCVDIYMRDCLLLNPTKGIIFTDDGVSGANRFNLDNIVMQTFGVGVQVDYCYDVSRFDGLHFWPFWSTAPAVQRWMQNNTEVIISKRNDNPIFTRIFSIWHKSGIRIGQSPTINGNLPGGSTSKLKLSDSDFDIGNTGYTVDADVTNHTAFWTNVSMQGINTDANPANNLPLIFTGGSNVSINATNTDLALAMGNAVRDTGTNNVLSFNGLNVQSFNQGDGGFPAFELNGTLYVSGRFTVTAENSASVFGGTGNYFADYWRSFNPSITTTTGTITALTVLVCRWRMTRTHVDFELDFIIDDNGTGAGILRCSLPITPSNFALLVGREVQVSGATLTGTVSSGNNNIEIGTTDNSYPGATGARIVINGSYSLNN